MRKIILVILLLFLLPTVTFAAGIYTQTPQGGSQNTSQQWTLFGSQWDIFTGMMTDTHTITQGSDFSNPSTLSSYDAVWVDQEQYNTLEASEVTTLQGFISGGKKAVFVGENNSWNSWNTSILSVVGGGYTP